MILTAESESLLELKSPPVVVCKLMELYSSDYHEEEIVDIVQVDPAITAKILNICNSPYVAPREPVSSLQQAVSLLGLGQLVNIVWNITLGHLLRLPLGFYEIPPDGLWHHSVTTAVTAQELCRLQSNPAVSEEVAFTAGLLHDIGKIVLNQALGSDSEKLRESLADEGVSIVAAERALHGGDHAQVGGDILRSWNLPSTLCEAVAHHHDPSSDQGDISDLVHIADYCAHAYGASYGYESFRFEMNPLALETSGLKDEHIEKATIGLHLRSSEVQAFIGI